MFFSSEYMITLCGLLAASCIAVFIVLLYYFKDSVDKYIEEEITAFFSSKDNQKLVKDIGDGKVSSKVSEALVTQLSSTQEPKARLKRLVMTLPVASCLFVISAIVGSLIFSENEFVSQIANELEYVADSLLGLAIVFFAYSLVQLVRLNKKLV